MEHIKESEFVLLVDTLLIDKLIERGVKKKDGS